MPNKTKASSRSKNRLKQGVQLKMIEWNSAREVLEQPGNRSKRLSILRETLELLGSQNDHLDRKCRNFRRLLTQETLTSEELAAVASE